MTMIEIMLAVMIIGLLAAIVAPRLSGVATRGKVRAAAREIASLARLGRATAVLAETEVELRFNPETMRYQLLYDYVEVERNRYTERTRRGRRRVRERDLEERARGRHEDLVRVRELPVDGEGYFEVFFASVDTELTVPHPENRRQDLPAIVFFPDGTASAAEIVLQGRQGERMSLEVFTATGLVEVSEGDIRVRRHEQDWDW